MRFLVLVCLALSLLVHPVVATHELPAPVAWWKLDETSGTTAEDSAGTNDGTLCGDGVNCVPPGGPTVGVSGHHGTAYSFDGTNDYVEVPETPAIDLVDQVSISVWVLMTDTCPVPMGVVVKVPSGFQYGLRLIQPNCIPQFVTRSAAANRFTTATIDQGVPQDGRFHHVYGMYESGIQSVWMDGVKLAETNPSGMLDSNTGSLKIGWDTVAGDQFQGIMDDVRVYDEFLTPSQIQDLYLDPVHNPCTEQTTQINSVSTNVGSGLIRTTSILAIIAGVVGTAAFAFGRRAAALALVGVLAGFSGVIASPTAVATDPCYLTGDVTVDSFSTFTITATFYMALALLVVGGIALARRG